MLSENGFPEFFEFVVEGSNDYSVLGYYHFNLKRAKNKIKKVGLVLIKSY